MFHEERHKQPLSRVKCWKCNGRTIGKGLEVELDASRLVDANTFPDASDTTSSTSEIHMNWNQLQYQLDFPDSPLGSP